MVSPVVGEEGPVVNLTQENSVEKHRRPKRVRKPNRRYGSDVYELSSLINVASCNLWKSPK